MIDAVLQVMPNVFDPYMEDYAKRQLKASGMWVFTSLILKGINGKNFILKIV